MTVLTKKRSKKPIGPPDIDQDEGESTEVEPKMVESSVNSSDNKTASKAATEISEITITIPVQVMRSNDPRTVHHLDVSVKPHQGRAAYSMLLGCLRDGKCLTNGSPVESHAGVVRWVLEKISEQLTLSK